MSYQVIARKYRPQRFEDVVGQEHVTQTLANAIQQNRIAHAYLFCGPRGTGKTTIARIFAKCLNCTGGPRASFPDDDPKCQEIAEGRSLDVIEIDGASNRGIDEIRELRDTVKYVPATSKFKIYIIDEVHMLTKEAFNALLKTLEEPPSHVKFMFATTEPEKVLPTILSRCQRFDLRRIPSALIVQHLKHIAKQESVTIEEGALYAIARGAEGGMRDAESTLDQLISFCGNQIGESDVLSMFGLTAQTQIMDLAGAVLAGDAEKALRELNDLAKGGKDLSRLLSDLLNHFRNLLIFQVSRGDMKLLEVSESEASTISGQSQSVTSEALTRIMEVLSNAETSLRDAASKKILVEVSLLKAIESRNAVSIDTVLKQLQQMRGGGGSVAEKLTATTPTPVKTAPARSAPEVQTRAAASSPAPVTSAPMASLSSANLGELWTQLIDAASRVSPFIKTYLLEAHPVSLEKNLLTIGFDPEVEDHLSLVDNSKNHLLISTKLSELGHPHHQVKFIKHEAPEGWIRPKLEEAVPATPAPASATPSPAGKSSDAPSAPAPAPASSKSKGAPIQLNKEDFKNDPLIKKALEVFKGQIVEVRG
jgi:DNA polymerase-3 subunit gamma/tau